MKKSYAQSRILRGTDEHELIPAIFVAAAITAIITFTLLFASL